MTLNWNEIASTTQFLAASWFNWSLPVMYLVIALLLAGGLIFFLRRKIAGFLWEILVGRKSRKKYM